MRRAIWLAAVMALVAAFAVPAQAGHAASVVFVNSFAGTCGGTPYDPNGPASGACVLGNDVIWQTTRPVLDDGPNSTPPQAPCNPGTNGGGSQGGCGQGVYLPGLGPPVVKPASALKLTKTGCTNQYNASCWSGGNFINVADSSVHPLAICLFAEADGDAGACKAVTRGSFYRPVSTVGAYSGTSEGCGRTYTEEVESGQWVIADLHWVHSAGTMLPITARVRFSNAVSASHTGASVFLLSNARSIAPTEPPGAGNGGLTDPGDSGTQRFSANTIQVTLPGNGPASIPAGPGAATYCPGTAF